MRQCLMETTANCSPFGIASRGPHTRILAWPSLNNRLKDFDLFTDLAKLPFFGLLDKPD